MVYSVFLPERFSASRIASSVQMPFQSSVPARFFYLRVSPLRWPENRLSPKPVIRICDYFIARGGICQGKKAIPPSACRETMRRPERALSPSATAPLRRPRRAEPPRPTHLPRRLSETPLPRRARRPLSGENKRGAALHNVFERLRYPALDRLLLRHSRAGDDPVAVGYHHGQPRALMQNLGILRR